MPATGTFLPNANQVGRFRLQRQQRLFGTDLKTFRSISAANVTDPPHDTQCSHQWIRVGNDRTDFEILG